MSRRSFGFIFLASDIFDRCVKNESLWARFGKSKMVPLNPQTLYRPWNHQSWKQQQPTLCFFCTSKTLFWCKRCMLPLRVQNDYVVHEDWTAFLLFTRFQQYFILFLKISVNLPRNFVSWRWDASLTSVNGHTCNGHNGNNRRNHTWSIGGTDIKAAFVASETGGAGGIGSFFTRSIIICIICGFV